MYRSSEFRLCLTLFVSPVDVTGTTVNPMDLEQYFHDHDVKIYCCCLLICRNADEEDLCSLLPPTSELIPKPQTIIRSLL